MGSRGLSTRDTCHRFYKMINTCFLEDILHMKVNLCGCICSTNEGVFVVQILYCLCDHVACWLAVDKISSPSFLEGILNLKFRF